eukprot:6487732-Amphidinium_carterae.1
MSMCAWHAHMGTMRSKKTPATPGVLRTPGAHSNSIFQAGVPCCQPHHRCSNAGVAHLCPIPWHGLAD